VVGSLSSNWTCSSSCPVESTIARTTLCLQTNKNCKREAAREKTKAVQQKACEREKDRHTHREREEERKTVEAQSASDANSIGPLV
jgi:hypothetical protein